MEFELVGASIEEAEGDFESNRVADGRREVGAEAILIKSIYQTSQQQKCSDSGKVTFNGVLDS